jgi:hypothetical protein
VTIARSRVGEAGARPRPIGCDSGVPACVITTAIGRRRVSASPDASSSTSTHHEYECLITAPSGA